MRLIFFISLLASFSISAVEVRWNYDAPPKFYRKLFENESFVKTLESIKKNTQINSNNEIQVIPLTYNEFIKWLNKGLVKMEEAPFESNKIKMYWHRDPKDKKKLVGFHVKQGNRVFCFPCQFKKGDRLVYGELMRKDVFLTQDGEEPIYQEREKGQKLKRTRKTFTDKSKQFEIQIMKGEYKITSKRNEEGELFSSINCFYQLRLHYKGKKIPELPQISFTNESTQAFIGLVDEDEVLLYMDDRIQRYAYRGQLNEKKLTEYSLIVPSDEFVRTFFWYAPGLKYAPAFNFLEKKPDVDLGDGKKVSQRKYYVKLDKHLEELLKLYRNDAFFNAREEYCHYIQSCFNASNISKLGISNQAKTLHKEDCQGVMTLEELKEHNQNAREQNKKILKK